MSICIDVTVRNGVLHSIDCYIMFVPLPIIIFIFTFKLM